MSLLKKEVHKYKPKEYSFKDHNLYQYYTLYNISVQKSQSLAATTPGCEFLLALGCICEHYFTQLIAASQHHTEVLAITKRAQEAFNDLGYDGEFHELSVHDVRYDYFFQVRIRKLEELRDTVTIFLATQAYRDLLAEFIEILDEIKWTPTLQQVNVEKLSPARRSFDSVCGAWFIATHRPWNHSFEHTQKYISSNTYHEWKDVWLSCQGENSLTELRSIHFRNLETIFRPDYSARFENGLRIVEPVLTTGSSSNLLHAIYSDRRFQHWLFQMLLFTIIITAALGATVSFIMQAAAGVAIVEVVVAGLSKFSANVMFGAAVGMGTVATITLAASLHARFFNQRPKEENRDLYNHQGRNKKEDHNQRMEHALPMICGPSSSSGG